MTERARFRDQLGGKKEAHSLLRPRLWVFRAFGAVRAPASSEASHFKREQSCEPPGEVNQVRKLGLGIILLVRHWLCAVVLRLLNTLRILISFP